MKLSLPVPNVQELVRENPSAVPERYIRTKEEMDKTLDMTSLCSEIPLIDLLLLSIGEEEELKKLEMACKEWGFFQVINHGVAEELLNNMKDSAVEFFDLPLEEKNKEITEAYSAEVKRVGEELLGSISLIMGLDKEQLLKMHTELMQAMRVNYYPSCSKPDQVLGISPHSDTSTITILLQGDNVDGLEIRHNEGWVPVMPISNALTVNIGDVIEIWSDGKYKSIEHRAMTNENKSRISFDSFIFPNDDVEVEPLDHLVDSSRASRMYKKVRYGDYLRQSMKQRHQGKAHTQMAKIDA